MPRNLLFYACIHPWDSNNEHEVKPLWDKCPRLDLDSSDEVIFFELFAHGRKVTWQRREGSPFFLWFFWVPLWFSMILTITGENWTDWRLWVGLDDSGVALLISDDSLLAWGEAEGSWVDDVGFWFFNNSAMRWLSSFIWHSRLSIFEKKFFVFYLSCNDHICNHSDGDDMWQIDANRFHQ